VVDGALALLLTGIDLEFNVAARPHPGGLPWPSVLTLLLGTLPLTLRRRAPRVVLGVVAAVALVAVVARLPVSELGLCVALYTVGARCPRRFSVPALGLFVLAKVLIEVRQAPDGLWLPVLMFSDVVAWVLGDQRRTQGLLAQQLRRHAERLERDREHRVRLAAADERARIARDLHDVVAHSVSVMVLHTVAARRTLGRDPARAEQALAQVETTGRQSLTELRQLLGVLREPGQSAEFAPQPRLAYLDELVASFREAGLPVTVEVDGEHRPLEAVVDMCAYRIVQEAMTNALKHAGAGSVRVRLAYRPDELGIEVVDDGRGPADGGNPGAEAGHGLAGMRERAALVGGRLRIGPGPAGAGFRVDAALPVERTS
jgi:signal transduction histidine kinase